MSMVSDAGGARMLQLMGGVSLSFYGWYSDLPPASPETWGEQTDVAESADWYNAKLLAVVGSNFSMTRTPDCHFAAEARHNGTKMWLFTPDFSQVSKYADEWVAIHSGQGRRLVDGREPRAVEGISSPAAGRIVPRIHEEVHQRRTWSR
jgi:nitrate reductase alpha subunit